MTGPQGMGVLAIGGGIPGHPGGFPGGITPVWFSFLNRKSTLIVWPTLAQAISWDIRIETVLGGTYPGGYYSYIAWFKDSGNAPISTGAFMLYETPKYWFDFDSKDFTVPWATLAQAISWDIRADVGALGALAGGIYTFEQWYDESGHAPSSYDSFITFITSTQWYAKLNSSRGSAPTWPTFAQAISNNIYLDGGTWPYNGPAYFESWWDESGEARSYDSSVTSIGAMWYSKLDTLV